MGSCPREYESGRRARVAALSSMVPRPGTRRWCRNGRTMESNAVSSGWRNCWNTPLTTSRSAILRAAFGNYKRSAILAVASSDVMTGMTSKSTMSLHCAIHCCRSCGSSVSISW